MKNFICLLFLLAMLQGATQNVGIGTLYPNNGKLVIKQTEGTSALVVGDSVTGLSFGELQNPFIGFNNYYRAGRKFMADGYAGYFYFNPSNGYLYFNNTAAAGTIGTSPSVINRFTVTKDGDVGIGTTGPAFRLDIAAGGLRLRDDNTNAGLRLDDASGKRSIIMKPNSNANAGEILLFEDGGDSTISIRGSDAAGQSGEILFRKPGVAGTTLEIDGDYGGTSRSRIIVDELQIKGGADFAEYFDVNETGLAAEPGMLVSIDAENAGSLVVSKKAYDKKVAGVISGANGIKAGMMMGHQGTIADGKHPVAISGRVYVKADATGAAIHPGDLLTTSDMPGFAMKAANPRKATGAIIGKAMTSLQAGQTGHVLVLLSIQ